MRNRESFHRAEENGPCYTGRKNWHTLSWQTNVIVLSCLYFLRFCLIFTQGKELLKTGDSWSRSQHCLILNLTVRVDHFRHLKLEQWDTRLWDPPPKSNHLIVIIPSKENKTLPTCYVRVPAQTIPLVGICSKNDHMQKNIEIKLHVTLVFRNSWRGFLEQKAN